MSRKSGKYHIVFPLRRGALVAMLGLAMLSITASATAYGQSDDNYQVAEDVAAYLGVMPAAIVGQHPAAHPELEMHGGPPTGAHAHHIVVALFDKPSGARIENAQVTASVDGLGHVGGTRLTLEAMPIEGVVTYGGFVTFPDTDKYTIDVEVSRPGQTVATKIRFTYEHYSE
jgi:hypothetical protein